MSTAITVPVHTSPTRSVNTSGIGHGIRVELHGGGNFGSSLKIQTLLIPYTKLLLFLLSKIQKAFALSILITMTIVFGTLAVIIETLPQFYGTERHQFWFILECVLIGLFTLELSLRCVANSETSDQFWSFACSFLTIVDLLSIIPFYLEIIIHGRHIGEFQKFTILRLFRLLRLLRTFQTSMLLKMSVEAMIIAVQRSFETLVAIVFFLVMIVIVSSTMIYYVERGEYDPARKLFIDIEGLPSKFDSIPATFWFVIEIVTTVGLGDVYPKTTAGRFITFPIMMFGLLIIALPSIVIGRNFADAWTWLRVNRVGRRTSVFGTLIPGASPVSPLPQHHRDESVKQAAMTADLTPRTIAGDEALVEVLREIRRHNALLERLLNQHGAEL